MASLFADFGLMNAGALAALAALAIPILIHLFNRSPGLRVVVGSVKLIRHAKSRRVTEIRLMQYLLLMLRLIIFTLLALILAGLSMRATTSLDKPQAYVTPAWMETVTENERQGLSNRFGLENIHTLQAPLWAHLVERLTSVKHTGEVHVFATSASGAFGPQMDSLQWPLVWHLKPNAQTDSTPKIKLTVTLVSAQSRESEAASVAKALSLLGQHRNVDITLRTVPADNLATDSLKDADWLFWLSPEDALADVLSTTNTNILHIPVQKSQGTGPLATMARYPFADYATTAPDQPFLEKSVLDGRLVHTLNARLLGEGSIVSQPSFPEILLDILLSADMDSTRFGASAVLTPDSGTRWPEIRYPQAPMEPWLVALLLIAWVLERWLSERGRQNG